jgi:hypothetical protein
MARAVADPTTMNHLALIRLLDQQGIEQTRLPEPLSFASLLTFHDSVELFLVLAADHLGAPLPRRDPNFLDYWQILRSTDIFTAGVDLSGQPAMDRLNRYRNALEHAGAFPGREAVEDARSSVSSFFENNTPAVFAVDFAAIDMADVVPQEPTRGRIKAAAAEDAGDRMEAMAQLAEAFGELFRPYAGSPFGFAGSYGFGPTVTAGQGFPIGLGEAMNAVAGQLRSNHARGLQAIGKKADDQIDHSRRRWLLFSAGCVSWPSASTTRVTTGSLHAKAVSNGRSASVLPDSPGSTADSVQRDWHGGRGRDQARQPMAERMSRPWGPDPARPDARRMRQIRVFSAAGGHA